jgi:NAD(P)-dependent dehydrogenase (short-subunit alcohol dehydrogenase family)
VGPILVLGCKMQRFINRVALVTGAASGIGRAAAERLAREGARVAVLDVDVAGGQSVTDAMHRGGCECIFVHADVSDEEQVRGAVADTAARLGPVDILINNAAAFVFRSIEATAADWNRVLSVNVMGAAFCVKHVLPEMQRAGKGAIVNLTSISGFIAEANSLTYSTSKAALLGLTRCMALDLVRWNIRVNAIAPGWVDTPQLRRDIARERMTFDEALGDAGPRHILGWFAQVSEIASAIAFLASDDASFLTGTCLMADGGYTAL